MDVLMLTFNDWANTGWKFSKCLELLELNVVFLKGKKHKFNYPNQGRIDPRLSKARGIFPPILHAPHLRPMMEEAKVIHFIASTFVNTGADLKGKNVVVQHGGTRFRKGPGKINSLFNSFSDYSIIQCPDLLGLGAKNEILIYYPVDTNFIQPNFDFEDPKSILVGHFPSNPQNKGTSTILKVIKKLKANKKLKFRYIGNPDTKRCSIDWIKNLDRLGKCDIIIETCNLVQNGRKFGEWGNTALEAAALGKIVVTNSLTIELYKKEYGNCTLYIANNENELENQLTKLITMDRSELKIEKERSRDWAVKNHSMEATAKRLWDKVYCNFF